MYYPIAEMIKNEEAINSFSRKMVSSVNKLVQTGRDQVFSSEMFNKMTNKKARRRIFGEFSELYV